jgi:hypothetical protein
MLDFILHIGAQFHKDILQLQNTVLKVTIVGLVHITAYNNNYCLHYFSARPLSFLV